MKRVFVIALVLMMGLVIFLGFACQKKEGVKTEISIDEKEVLEAIYQKPKLKSIGPINCPGYDPIRLEDFWIKGGSVMAMYAKTYIDSASIQQYSKELIDSMMINPNIIPDSLMAYKVGAHDSVFRNAGYIRGTKCGDKVFFKEYYIDGEIGIEKYLFVDDLVKDPRATERWNRLINEMVFDTIEKAIEECACLNYPESQATKKLTLEQIQKKIPLAQYAKTPEEIKSVLLGYTNLYN